VWAPVVCPARREPGAGQPDQYALDRGVQPNPTRAHFGWPFPTAETHASATPPSASSQPVKCRGVENLSTLRSGLMTDTTRTYRLWKTLAPRPGGTRVFSAAAMLRVPYFASIVPHVRRMEPGFAEVSVPKWFYVHNHLGTVHAIASSNAAELAMGRLVTSLMAEADSFVGLTQPQILLCGASPDAARRTSPIPNGTLPVSNDKSRRNAAEAPIPPMAKAAGPLKAR
jgi:Domain of unknown function (DUF4442)